MNERTDLGWFTFGVDQPPSNLANINFANGIFSATATASQPNFWLLDSYVPGTAPLGKIGANFPIDSTRFRRLLMRLNLSAGGAGQLVWSNNSIFNGVNSSNGFVANAGSWIYSIDIPTLGVAAGTAWSAKPVDALRVQPVNVSGANLSLDWARLVAFDATLNRTITWTGGAVDIFLDNDQNAANGLSGRSRQRHRKLISVLCRRSAAWHVLHCDAPRRPGSPTRIQAAHFRWTISRS